jgi:hypothetical protein
MRRLPLGRSRKDFTTPLATVNTHPAFVPSRYMTALHGREESTCRRPGGVLIAVKCAAGVAAACTRRAGIELFLRDCDGSGFRSSSASRDTLEPGKCALGGTIERSRKA